jgi:hypothetical protein
VDLEQWLASKRSVLATRINTRVWYNYLFDDRPKTHDAGPKMLDWTRPNSLLAGFAKQIDEYALEILTRLRSGLDVHDDIEHFRVLTPSVASNMNRLRKGDGKLFPKSPDEVSTALKSNFRHCLHQDSLRFAKTREE